MSRFAALLMFCAWLLYGAMPAMAMFSAPAPASTAHVMPMMQDPPQHHEHGWTNEATKAQPGDDEPQPCPHGGKSCMAPFCAACLTILPEIAIGDAGRFVHAYPAPAIGQAFASPAPAPLTPPPRD